MKSETKQSLGDRMKGYEDSYRFYLPRRLPVIIRLDGCHFSTVTRRFQKPYDRVFSFTMAEVLRYLVENIQGCVFGWTVSDEISLLLRNDQTLTTDAWYGNNLQKMVSVSASMASTAFRKLFWERTRDIDTDYHFHRHVIDEVYGPEMTKENLGAYSDTNEEVINFDSRAFVLPPEEVCNYFIWRQKDGRRNAVSALAQTLYSHKELQGISSKDLITKMKEEKNVDFKSTPQSFRNGISCYKMFGELMLNYATPVLTEDRDFIEKWLRTVED